MIFVNSLNFQQRIEQTLQIQFGVTIDHASKTSSIRSDDEKCS